MARSRWRRTTEIASLQCLCCRAPFGWIQNKAPGEQVKEAVACGGENLPEWNSRHVFEGDVIGEASHPGPDLLRRGPANLKYLCQLTEIGITRDERDTKEQFGYDTPHRPYVHPRAVQAGSK